MDSVLSVLAMVGGLLVLGWFAGSGDEQGKQERPEEEPPPERLHDQSGPCEGAMNTYAPKEEPSM